MGRVSDVAQHIVGFRERIGWFYSCADCTDWRANYATERDAVDAVASHGCDTTDVIDMDAVASEIQSHGVPAFVQNSGGGCATLYAGELIGDYYAACAGPGVFAGPDWTMGRAFADDFWVGTDGVEDAYALVTVTDPKAVAAVVLAVVAARKGE